MNPHKDDFEFPDEKNRQKKQRDPGIPYADDVTQANPTSQQDWQHGTNSSGSGYGQDENVSRQLRRESRNFMGSIGSIGAYGSLGATGATRFTGAINPASDSSSLDEMKHTDQNSGPQTEQ
ncbi:hypothetical protein [Oscillibacter sp.]|uniref:hypothetical protein n=1 Tax=Oscillibacter sp. TaxID=1945593 RepID=UPI0028B19F18|nr:hypothetical protein [Oscillibacter sp.]